jgi:hypothetical protein
MMYDQAAAAFELHLGVNDHVHRITEVCRVRDAKQVGSRRPSERHVLRHPQCDRPAGEVMVAIDPGVGVDVVSKAHPRWAAELICREHEVVDRL